MLHPQPLATIAKHGFAPNNLGISHDIVPLQQYDSICAYEQADSKQLQLQILASPGR